MGLGEIPMRLFAVRIIKDKQPVGFFGRMILLAFGG
jgi:hypothetical protein